MSCTVSSRYQCIIQISYLPKTFRICKRVFKSIKIDFFIRMMSASCASINMQQIVDICILARKLIKKLPRLHVKYCRNICIWWSLVGGGGFGGGGGEQNLRGYTCSLDHTCAHKGRSHQHCYILLFSAKHLAIGYPYHM